ncbi:MAG: PilZ domain-containing protein [Syntrophobacterales bacterium]|jgi:hypothetical protein
MERDKRLYPRSKVKWPVTMTTSAGTIEGETIDVSTLGAYIQCPEQLNPSENLLLSVRLPAGSPLQVFAEVVWSSSTGLASKSGPPGMGVRFLW